MREPLLTMRPKRRQQWCGRQTPWIWRTSTSARCSRWQRSSGGTGWHASNRQGRCFDPDKLQRRSQINTCSVHVSHFCDCFQFGWVHGALGMCCHVLSCAVCGVPRVCTSLVCACVSCVCHVLATSVCVLCVSHMVTTQVYVCVLGSNVYIANICCVRAWCIAGTD